MNPRDELRMLVLFYVGGVMGIDGLKQRLETIATTKETALTPSGIDTAVLAAKMLAACADYSAPIKGWNVGELADRDQILVNKLKVAVQ
jgi:hypothetical protein